MPGLPNHAIQTFNSTIQIFNSRQKQNMGHTGHKSQVIVLPQKESYSFIN